MNDKEIITERACSKIMAQLPVDQDGRLYHLGLKAGELEHRILCVGDPSRAYVIAQLLDGAKVDPANSQSLGNSVFVHVSGRGFSTYSGKYKGVPISIVAIGMGTAMMDFFVREARAILPGHMAIIRFGTCGTLVADVEIGQYVVNTASRLVTRNVDAFTDLSHRDSSRVSISTGLDSYYHVSRPAFPSASLNNLLLEELRNSGEPFSVGENATADSFYSSQGRLENGIVDSSAGMLEILRDEYNVRTLEMETFQLFHLAECCKIESSRSIQASAMVIVVANRPKNTFIVSDDRKHHLEQVGGTMCLSALIHLPL